MKLCTNTFTHRVLGKCVFGAAMLACALLGARGQGADGAAASVVATAPAELPSHWQGQPVRPLALSAVEQRFAQAFPGHIARLTDGHQIVVLREVRQPTRMLHPAVDCFRALGYRIEGERLEYVPPRSPAARGALPPEGALAVLGRPGGSEDVPPRSPAARGALPPEGALAALGRPGGSEDAPPRSPAARGALPPEGALAALGRPGGSSVALRSGVGQEQASALLQTVALRVTDRLPLEEAPAASTADAAPPVQRCFTARKGDVALRVCEQIEDAAGRRFADTSAWYWAAALGQSSGPWRAVTVTRPWQAGDV